MLEGTGAQIVLVDVASGERVDLPVRCGNGTVGSFTTIENLFHSCTQSPDGAHNFASCGQHSGDHYPSYFGAGHTTAHFITQTVDGRLCAVDYCRGNNKGLGHVVGIVPEPEGREGARPEDAEIANIAGQRVAILGEVHLRKFDDSGAPILDPNGNPDTSFLVRLPANMPYLMQGIDCDGRTLNTDQSWQYLRPGEMKTCGGCHVHSRVVELDFAQSYAATDAYRVAHFGGGQVPLLAGSPVVQRWPPGWSRATVSGSISRVTSRPSSSRAACPATRSPGDRGYRRYADAFDLVVSDGRPASGLRA